MFVIPCRYDPTRPVVDEAVAAIRELHPDEKILVVDSCSDERGYLFDLQREYGTISISGNKHYAPGAFQYAVTTYRNEDFFYLFFDSLIVNANLDSLKAAPLTTVRWIDSARHGWGWNETTGQPLDDWARAQGVQIPPRFNGVFGPMIAASRETILAADLFRVLPASRYEVCALERCWGIWLTEAGYDVTNSLQGEHVGHFDSYDETRVRKIEMTRA